MGVLTACYSPSDIVNESNPVEIGGAKREDNLLLGNPTDATTSSLSANNYLIVRAQYALSYNNSKLTANWGSWHLSSSWLGSVGRQDNFRADYSLPNGWYAVGSDDFKGTGFDRGHICPSADRTASVADNSATFLMTNMIPQSPDNNQKTWNEFEGYCRSLVQKGQELYIIAGPYGQGGVGNNGFLQKIGQHGIVVPQYTWKIVLVLLNGENDLGRIDERTRVIAIWVPNSQVASVLPWHKYRVSVDFIEEKTGCNFFSKLPETTQTIIESRIDNVTIN